MKLSNEQIEEVLEDVKDELLDRLFEVVNEYHPIDFRQSEKVRASRQTANKIDVNV